MEEWTITSQHSAKQSSMGGGGTMHVDHPVPQFRSSMDKWSSPSSSSSSPNLKPPVSTDNTMLFTPHSSLSLCCQSQLCKQLELVDGEEKKTLSGCLYHHVFEPVPSQQEVDDAVSALQDFVQAVSSSTTLQHILGSFDSRILLSQGYQRLYDALQLLHSDPSMKRLVVSLSSDKAIWDAVISNVLHQKLPELPDSDECKRHRISEQRELSIHILSWILGIIKGKVLELIESFQSLMNDLCQSPRKENATVDAAVLDEKVRSSVLLSIVIILIIIMARS